MYNMDCQAYFAGYSAFRLLNNTFLYYINAVCNFVKHAFPYGANYNSLCLGKCCTSLFGHNAYATNRRKRALSTQANKVLSFKRGLLLLALPSMQTHRERLCLPPCHANLLSMSLLIKHTSEDCNPPDVFLISIRFPALAYQSAFTMSCQSTRNDTL